MFCYNCGYKANDGDRFCKECGTILRQQKDRQTIKLTCEDCGGVLTVDSSRTILTCPYCGSKKLIPENDEVVIARINKCVDEQRMRHEKEMREYEESIRMKKEQERKQKEDDDAKWVFGKFVPGCILFMLGCFVFIFLISKL